MSSLCAVPGVLTPPVPDVVPDDCGPLALAVPDEAVPDEAPDEPVPDEAPPPDSAIDGVEAILPPQPVANARTPRAKKAEARMGAPAVLRATPTARHSQGAFRTSPP